MVQLLRNSANAQVEPIIRVIKRWAKDNRINIWNLSISISMPLSLSIQIHYILKPEYLRSSVIEFIYLPKNDNFGSTYLIKYLCTFSKRCTYLLSFVGNARQRAMPLERKSDAIYCYIFQPFDTNKEMSTSFRFSWEKEVMFNFRVPTDYLACTQLQLINFS